MKRDKPSPRGSAPAAARDLPPGAILTTKGTTAMAPLATSGPPAATTAVAPISPTLPAYPGPPPMPTGPRLADHHYAVASQKPALPAVPARPHRSTFDEPLPQVKTWRGNAQALRKILGATLNQVESCITQAGQLLAIFDANPKAAEQAAHEGVDLAEAREFHTNLVALVAQYQPQPETKPEETTQPATAEA